MINVSDIYNRRIADIQSRIPVKLKISNKSSSSVANNPADSTNFQSILKQEVNSLNSASTQNPDNSIKSSTSAVSGQTVNNLNYTEYIGSSKNVNDSAQRNYIESVIDTACLEYGVSPILIRSIVKAESDFNPRTVSSAGAMGLMQLMPINAEEMGVSDPFDIVENINAGVKIIKATIEKYNGDLPLILADYNAGPGAVKKYGGVPPYTETQNYIKKVSKFMEEFESNT